MPDFFTLHPTVETIRDARRWGVLALISLALSGLAPLLLVAGRASIYAEVSFVKEWFVPMLVLHVNLSVGLWFIAVACMIGTLQRITATNPYINRMLQTSFALGLALFVITPVAGGPAYTSNYIPVQDNLFFFLGLGLIAAVVLIHSAQILLAENPIDLMQQMGYLLAITLLMSLFCFFWSAMQHPPGYSGEPYFEAIFWGGGHMLQNAFMLIGMMAWLYLARALNWQLPPLLWIQIPLMVLLITVLGAPLIYTFFTVNSGEHIRAFTLMMAFITGVVPIPLVLWLLVVGFSRFVREEKKGLSWTLYASLILYGVGGLASLLIEGSDVTIPAHYHGSTGSITLASMGLFYLLLPRFGGADVSAWLKTMWQPILYATGQILFVIGFIWAGGYDVARKTAGALDESQQGAALALQIYRFGGLLAVIGGALFIIIVILSWKRRPKQLPSQTS